MPPNRRRADTLLQAAWRRRGSAAFALLPLAAVFVALRTVRRWLYRIGWLRSERLPVPVVVVGNITVGGVGKTPLVTFLARALAAQGWSPGIVSRGYGAATSGERLVANDDPATLVGDEPALLHRLTQCPVAVGADRVAAARLLLQAHPGTRVILCDDGLQHYRLGRTLEIAVTSRESEMNGWPLPAGPMRESRRRLATVDAVVVADSAVPPAPTLQGHSFSLHVHGGSFYALADPRKTRSAAELRGQPIHAVAGIGNPERFFRQLEALGLRIERHAFPDHHAYAASDLAFGDGVVVTTEKDAVKLSALASASPIWVMPLEVSVEPDLVQFIVEKLHGCASA